VKGLREESWIVLTLKSEVVAGKARSSLHVRNSSRKVVNSGCRFLVTEARQLGLEVIDRCNLTVLQEPGQEDLVDFLAANQAYYLNSRPPLISRLQNLLVSDIDCSINK
jgi:hypothetical protein